MAESPHLLAQKAWNEGREEWVQEPFVTGIRPLSSAILTLYATIQMWLSGPDTAQSNPDLSVGGLMTRDVICVQW